jgi:hypothetical protein
MNPADSLQFLEHYGVLIVPALVVAEQIGVPLPAVPALLGVGALAAHGRISIPLVLAAIAVVGAGRRLRLVRAGPAARGRRPPRDALPPLPRAGLLPAPGPGRPSCGTERAGHCSSRSSSPG